MKKTLALFFIILLALTVEAYTAPRPAEKPFAIIAHPVAPHEGNEVGVAVGVLAGIPAVSADFLIWRPLGINGTGFKTGFKYAQGEDPNAVTRKNALVFADGIFYLFNNQGSAVYLGGGLNYLAYTTGQKSGTVGGQAYLGFKVGSLQYGFAYLEAGYALVRSGFSPSLKGLALCLGYRVVL